MVYAILEMEIKMKFDPGISAKSFVILITLLAILLLAGKLFGIW